MTLMCDHVLRLCVKEMQFFMDAIVIKSISNVYLLMYVPMYVFIIFIEIG